MTVDIIKPEQGNLGIPAERLHQLRAIAKHRNSTIVSIIEAAIAQAIETGEIPDELDGFATVVPDDDVLFVTIRGASLPALNRAKALVVATVLEAAAGVVNDELGFKIQVGKATGIDLGHGVKLAIGRHSKAVLLSLHDAQTNEPTMRTATSTGIALDFARILRKHAQTLMVVDA